MPSYFIEILIYGFIAIFDLVTAIAAATGAATAILPAAATAATAILPVAATTAAATATITVAAAAATLRAIFARARCADANFSVAQAATVQYLNRIVCFALRTHGYERESLRGTRITIFDHINRSDCASLRKQGAQFIFSGLVGKVSYIQFWFHSNDLLYLNTEQTDSRKMSETVSFKVSHSQGHCIIYLFKCFIRKSEFCKGI